MPKRVTGAIFDLWQWWRRGKCCAFLSMNWGDRLYSSSKDMPILKRFIKTMKLPICTTWRLWLPLWWRPSVLVFRLFDVPYGNQTFVMGSVKTAGRGGSYCFFHAEKTSRTTKNDIISVMRRILYACGRLFTSRGKAASGLTDRRVTHAECIWYSRESQDLLHSMQESGFHHPTNVLSQMPDAPFPYFARRWKRRYFNDVPDLKFLR